MEQSARTAIKNVKFRSNLILTDWFTVETVGQREEDLDISARLETPRKPALKSVTIREQA
jgi:hypothetical protein